MDLPSALELGALQGITEFLPVSSSGHLVLAQRLLGWKEPNLFFDICLHVGTFLAVIVVFRRDIRELIRGGLQWIGAPFSSPSSFSNPSARLFLWVLCASVPTALMGFLFKDVIEALFASTAAVGTNLLITGTLLWLTRKKISEGFKKLPEMRLQDALLVGTAQGFAIAPGISRSGITIAVALFLGFQREWAGRFSFLLFVPAIVGALLLELTHLETVPEDWSPILWGTATAAVVGYIALRVLLRVLHRGRFHLFAPYCWILGIVSLAATWLAGF